ncbi:hypothetical protein AcV7_008079 [Taiwanofungus camphoratus]|nr:hypothetical protein AcW2_006632 [Antrodia cinnamomea]KAI0952198.1 hypothetical protein AcV7_008079 [Antrodia cinnamomea]
MSRTPENTVKPSRPSQRPSSRSAGSVGIFHDDEPIAGETSLQCSHASEISHVLAQLLVDKGSESITVCSNQVQVNTRHPLTSCNTKFVNFASN